MPTNYGFIIIVKIFLDYHYVYLKINAENQFVFIIYVFISTDSNGVDQKFTLCSKPIVSEYVQTVSYLFMS